MKPTISAIAKSTKDYPRPCRGASLMGSQEVASYEGWPKMKGFPPRLAGLVGCATGRKNELGEDTRESGPAQLAELLRSEGKPTVQHITEDDVIELSDSLLHSGDAQ